MSIDGCAHAQLLCRDDPSPTNQSKPQILTLTHPHESIPSLSRALQVEPAKVSAKARFKEDLSLDSLDVVEVRATDIPFHQYIHS